MALFDENDMETVIIVNDPKAPEVGPTEYKYTKERYAELAAQYGKENVYLQARMAWQ